MEARVFKAPEQDGSINPDTVWLCVDGKVHLTQTPGWQLDGEMQPSYVSSILWRVLTLCDGSCIEKMQLPAEVEVLVQRFLDTNGHERGEFNQEIESRPWAKYQEMFELRDSGALDDEDDE